jgi:Uncharacterized alpha/beta hydrolase domain (DUF2235)
MSQIGEAIAALFHDDEPEQDANKAGLKIRIALFYDGTLNNRHNIEQREKNTDTYQKKRDPKGPNSYDNGRTNINIMEAQLEKTADGYDYYLKFYIEGQGTFDDEKDSLAGYSLGTFSSGVPQRATKGIQLAVSKIQEVLEEKLPEDFFIEKLTIDVFGFSRGAATARQSIHQMIKSTLRPMYIRLRGIGYDDTKKSAVKVCFAGLYDTVLSYWAGQYLHTEWLLDMKAIAEAEKVIHFAAADEHRIDFPVTNIKSAKSKGVGEEYYLPGVHSDVGGSYNMALDLESQKELPEVVKEYMRTTSEIERILNEGTNREKLEADRINILAQGWYDPDKLEVVMIRAAIPPSGGPHGHPGLPAQYALKATRENIHTAYCNIPLKIMARLAQQHGVKIKSDLEKTATLILSKEADNALDELEVKINNHVNSKTTTSSPAYWLTDPAMNPIRKKHFNFSSKTGMGYSPRFVDGKRSRYEVDA